ncbi:hypothetical protein WJX79_005706 [Trebouxia sp. C0005]
MLGFAIPLLILGAILSAIGILLLSPPPFDKPAVLLCRATKTSAGWTVVATLSTVLAVMSVSPLWDVAHMRRHAKESSADSLQRRSQMVEAQLTAVLTGACLVLIFVVRKLGLVIAQRDSLTTSQQAMLKQVEGLRNEYNRVTSGEQPKTGGASASDDTAQLKQQAQSLQKKLDEAVEDRRRAKADAEALKNQSRGLEKEYDRLLQENDDLKRKLSRHDSSATYQASNKRD